MIAHLALFRFKEGTTDAQIAALTEALTALPAQIEVLRSYTALPNLRVRPGADFGVIAIADDADDVGAYLDHPAHMAVVEQHMAPIMAERTVVQLPYAGPLA